MYGLETSIDVLKLKDEMMNSELGYSFMVYPTNELENSFTYLLTYACIVYKALLALSGYGC